VSIIHGIRNRKHWRWTCNLTSRASFDALPVGRPVDKAKNVFHTARADDETDINSCMMEDCHHFAGVTEYSTVKADWKSRNGFKWQ